MQLATLSTWRGYPRWKCRLCSHTDTNAERMHKHLTSGGRGHNIKIEYTIPEVAPEDMVRVTPDGPEPIAPPETDTADDASDADVTPDKPAEEPKKAK